MKFRKPIKTNRFLHSIQLGLRLLPTVEPGFKEILKKHWNKECGRRVLHEHNEPTSHSSYIRKNNSVLTNCSIEQSPVTRCRTRCTTGLIQSDNFDIFLYYYLSLQSHDVIRFYQ